MTTNIAKTCVQGLILGTGSFVTCMALIGPRWVKRNGWVMGFLLSQTTVTLAASGLSLAVRKWANLPNLRSLPVQIFSATILGLFIGARAKFVSAYTSKGVTDVLSKVTNLEEALAAFRPYENPDVLPLSQSMQCLISELKDLIESPELHSKITFSIDQLTVYNLSDLLKFAAEQHYSIKSRAQYPYLKKAHRLLPLPASLVSVLIGFKCLSEAAKIQEDSSTTYSPPKNMHELFTRAATKGKTPERPESPETQLEWGVFKDAFLQIFHIDSLLADSSVRP